MTPDDIIREDSPCEGCLMANCEGSLDTCPAVQDAWARELHRYDDP